MSERRDIEPGAAAEEASSSSGRSVLAAIGIDRYQAWQRLTNAVSDARGAAALFARLGFEQVTEPLLDSRATRGAIEGLVTDDLRTLGPDDSLVLFYAGHGGTRTHRLGSQVVKTGYLIPVDGTDRVATWIELDGWLRAVSLLPAKHILVLLDACHSGIALGSIIKWRDTGTWKDLPLSTLNARRSRRIITSALDDQVALDSGPVYGHSLFTGCLIEGLSHGLGRAGRRMTTGSELGLYLQRRVETYPNSRQTPDFGTFDFDDRGEMAIPLLIERPDEAAVPMRSTSPAEAGSEDPPVASPVDPGPATGLGPGAAARPPVDTGEGPVSLPPWHEAPVPAKPVPARPRAYARVRRWAVIWVVAGLVLSVLNLAYNRFSKKPASPVVDPFPDQAQIEASEALMRTLPGDPAAAAAGVAQGSCPKGMIRVPAGTFQMGSPDGEGVPDEHPQHTVTLSGFCIDRTEVTVTAYEACVAARGCSAAQSTAQWSGASTTDVALQSKWCNRTDRPQHPMNCVSWEQATAYCKWAGKRLPTEAMWEYAARGSDGRKYPWGNQEPSAARLNACGLECVAMAEHDLNARWEAMYVGGDGWETTAPVGSYRHGASPFGVLDMAGNVLEWTADRYDHYTAAAATDPQGPETGEHRVIRGGGWHEQNRSSVRAAVRGDDAPTSRYASLGFRCAQE